MDEQTKARWLRRYFDTKHFLHSDKFECRLKYANKDYLRGRIMRREDELLFLRAELKHAGVAIPDEQVYWDLIDAADDARLLAESELQRQSQLALDD